MAAGLAKWRFSGAFPGSKLGFMEKILVSACLLGRPVRYDGGDKALESDLLAVWQKEGRVVALCPEMEAGLPVPRPAAEIAGGADGAEVLERGARIHDECGNDVTDAFRSGANKALAIARAQGCRYALLTDGSPSCGSSFIYDGSFTGAKVPGMGIVTALLRDAGLEVFNEVQIEELAQRLAAPARR